MWFKYPIIIVLFLFLSILQNSFLQYFRIGIGLDLVFIMFFILIFFEEKGSYDIGFWSSIIAGFFLDIFSLNYFGLSIIVLLVIYSLEKLSVYLIRQRDYKFSILSFTYLFLASFLLYIILSYFIYPLLGSRSEFSFNFGNLFGIIYNLVFAYIGFYAYRKFILSEKNSQLRLF